MTYNSLDEIDRDFGQRIEREEDPVQKAELRVQAAQAKVAFREQEANGRMVDAWRRLAIVEFPQAGKFPELVRGSTEDEIRASAKEVHERVAGMMRGAQGGEDNFQRVQQDARQLYGPSGSGVGGGMPAFGQPANPDMAEERWRQGFADSFNSARRDIYGQRMDIAPGDVDRYVRGRFTTHVADRVKFWGQLTRSSG